MIIIAAAVVVVVGFSLTLIPSDIYCMEPKEYLNIVGLTINLL